MLSPSRFSHANLKICIQWDCLSFKNHRKPFWIYPESLVSIKRLCQHQCPIVLVHEPKRMHELVHGHDHPSVKAGGVQVHWLVPASHSDLALALCAWIDSHKVRAPGFCRHKGDAGEHVSEVVHRLPCQNLQSCEKCLCWFKSEWRLTWRESLPELICHDSAGPQSVRVSKERMRNEEWRISLSIRTNQDIAFVLSKRLFQKLQIWCPVVKVTHTHPSLHSIWLLLIFGTFFSNKLDTTFNSCLNIWHLQTFALLSTILFVILALP